MAGNNILINVLANTQQLVAGMRRAENTVLATTRVMSRAVAGFGALFISGAITNAIFGTADAIDALGKTSSKLNIGVEALQGLQLSAELTGVSVNTLETSIQRMNRRIYEATQGTGEAKTALRELGLEANILNNMKTEDAFLAIADALDKVDNTGKKTALAMKLFDTEGVALINTFKGGADAINGYIKEQERLGVLTGSQVKNVEDMNDSYTSLSKAVSYLGDLFVANISPAMKSLGNSLTDIVTDTNIFKGTIELLSTVFSVLVNTVSAFVKTLQLAYEGWRAFIAIVTGDDAIFAQASANIKKVELDLAKLFGEMIAPPPPLLVIEKSVPDSIIEVVTLWDDMKKAMRAYYEEHSVQSKIATQLVNSLASTMVNGIAGGFRKMLDGAVNWGDTFKNIIKDVIAQLIKVLVVQKAVNALAGAIGGIGGEVSSKVASAGAGTVASGAVAGARSLATNQRGLNVNVVNNVGASVGISERGGDLNVIIDAVNDNIANGIQRNTSPISQALETSYGLSR